jgi:hypothetical protein
VAVITPPACGAPAADELALDALDATTTKVAGAITGVVVSVGGGVFVGVVARVGVVKAFTETVGAVVVFGDRLFNKKNAPTAMMPRTSKPPKPSAMIRNNRLGPPPAGAISAILVSFLRG